MTEGTGERLREAMFVLDENVTLLSQEVIADRICPGLNTVLTFLVHRERGLLRFEAADCGGLPHPRVADTITYLRHLHAVTAAEEHSAAFDAPSFLFQAEDNPGDAVSASWEARKDWASITLVPDIYYYQARGYEDFLVETVPWRQRDDQLLWRGSTTGILGLSLDRLQDLPRYRLCRIAASLGKRADCGFTNVVQGLTPEHDAAVDARLRQEDLIRNYIPTPDMQRARYAIDIDGNSNSWNFIQRLRLGACMLRVESAWHQWFEPRLSAWEHYVPIRSDMSDLIEKMDWCARHPQAAEDIAGAGRAFALRTTFAGELSAAGRTLFVPN
ncbi:hypothetical protein HL653_07330 [Sphingomonas sp. AP4-R1]|uniref:glycosyl transferase family 90 n=1 Tax=Sphingomonas sp. AP4-R1 TaxID=2735134 RepID=UPI0014935F78|nr:glycosyl transferase family 90 [Sphingomonas sp. AP4-R1]QJU57626.1 hypothetical protein HL653_07330 [Sphingomonas sp. AP4-R1]